MESNKDEPTIREIIPHESQQKSLDQETKNACQGISGSHTAGYVHPKSIETLKRHGIDPDELQRKSRNKFAGQSLDSVITVCDHAQARAVRSSRGAYEDAPEHA